MAQERIQKQKQTSKASERTHTEDTNVDVTNAELGESTEEVLDSIEDVLEDQLDLELLEEIDGVLEENAEEFVNSFIQQGGE